MAPARRRGRGADHPRPSRRLPARRLGGPLLLYGYGAYGMASTRPSPHRALSLLDRGFAFAIAHVRGGDEMGARWYRSGKLYEKPNTLHRLHRLRRAPDPRGLHPRRPDRDQGRQRRRHADGRGGQPAARPVGLRDRRGAVRRRAEHDARRDLAADADRVARMGQPDRGRARLRADPRLLALRQCRAAALPADAGHRRHQRSAGDLLGAGQVRGRGCARPRPIPHRCCSRPT